MVDVKLLKPEEIQYKKFMEYLNTIKTPEIPDDDVFTVKVTKDDVDISYDNTDLNKIVSEGYTPVGNYFPGIAMTNGNSYIFFRKYNDFDKLFFKLIIGVKDMLDVYTEDFLKKNCSITQIINIEEFPKDFSICFVNGVCNAFISMMTTPLVVQGDQVSNIEVATVSTDYMAVRFIGEVYGKKFSLERIISPKGCDHSYFSLVGSYAK